jgi:hypothetical protein
MGPPAEIFAGGMKIWQVVKQLMSIDDSNKANG